LDVGRREALTAPGLLTGLLLSILLAQVGVFIVSHSNTFDEPAVTGAGFSYVKTGRLELETHVHPPLLKYLFGLSVSLARPDFNAQSPALKEDRPYQFGHEFLYKNSVNPETLLSLARLPSLLLSLAAAICLSLWAKRWFGPWGGVLALAVYVFEPNILAHSGLANMDLALTAFLFLAYFFLVRYLEEPRLWRLIASGVLAGCAMSTKLPGLFFFAWSSSLILLMGGRLGRAIKINAVLFLAAACVLLLCYQVRYIPALLGLLKQMLPAMFVDHPTEQHYNFLHGALKRGGWPQYYLVALAVKTSLPFLALAALGFAGLSKKERIILGLPALSYFLICTTASKQNGLRYILPAFPFLCLAAGSLARRRGRSWLLGLCLLIGWSAVEAMRLAPNYLAYFNQLAGGPRNGYRWMVDSNLDWGQDFPRIQELLRRAGRPETIIATLGNGDRDYFFGPHQDLLAWSQGPGEPSHINSADPRREWLIVSASFLQGFGLNDPQAFSWLRSMTPLAQPGYSTFVYDVTSDGLSQFNIGKLYLRNRQYEAARRQFERAAALSPGQPQPFQALGDLYRAQGQERKAAAAYASALKRSRP
jgi:tetratricopeptide (TPR) repeat protein